MAVGRHEHLRTKLVRGGIVEGSRVNHSCAGGQAHEVDMGRGSGCEQDA